MSHLADHLSADTLFMLAERESGAFGLAGEGLRKRVKSMVDWINSRGPYTPDQVVGMRRQLQGILVNRLRLILDRKSFAGIAQEKIERPIFVIGFAHEAKLQSWLSNPNNKVDRYGRYPYTYEALGFDKGWVKNLFADYSKRFGLQEES